MNQPWIYMCSPSRSPLPPPSPPDPSRSSLSLFLLMSLAEGLSFLFTFLKASSWFHRSFFFVVLVSLSFISTLICQISYVLAPGVVSLKVSLWLSISGWFTGTVLCTEALSHRILFALYSEHYLWYLFSYTDWVFNKLMTVAQTEQLRWGNWQTLG